jgi:hypothetical protein
VLDRNDSHRFDFERQPESSIPPDARLLQLQQSYQRQTSIFSANLQVFDSRHASLRRNNQAAHVKRALHLFNFCASG